MAPGASGERCSRERSLEKATWSLLEAGHYKVRFDEAGCYDVDGDSAPAFFGSELAGKADQVRGKTTLAREMERGGAVRLSLDEWTIAAGSHS